MKTKYEYIEFVESDCEWHCFNKRGRYILGFVNYVPKWKEWEFQPEPNMGFTIECLRDIADFLGQLNKGT